MNKNLEIVYKINQIADYFNKQADNLLKQEYGMSYRQYLVLVGLNYMQPCSQKQISEFVHLTSAGTLHLLNILENLELITKKIDENNKRTVLIEITDRGQNAFSDMNYKLGERLNVLIKLPKDDMVQLDRIVSSLLDI